MPVPEVLPALGKQTDEIERKKKKLTAKIIAFKSLLKEPGYISGEAKCIQCQHKWIAVAEIGATWLECPECKSMKGIMVFNCERDGLHWKCNCENNLFHITPDGIYCPNCGQWQSGF